MISNRVRGRYEDVVEVHLPLTKKTQLKFRTLKELNPEEENSTSSQWIYLLDILSALASSRTEINALKKRFLDHLAEKYDGFQTMRYKRQIVPTAKKHSNSILILSSPGASLLCNLYRSWYPSKSTKCSFLKKQGKIHRLLFGTSPYVKHKFLLHKEDQENKKPTNLNSSSKAMKIISKNKENNNNILKNKKRRASACFADVEGQPKKKRKTALNLGDKTKSLRQIEFVSVYFQPYELPDYYRGQFDGVLSRVMPNMGWAKDLTSYDFHSFLVRSQGSKRGESVIGGICFQYCNINSTDVEKQLRQKEKEKIQMEKENTNHKKNKTNKKNIEKKRTALNPCSKRKLNNKNDKLKKQNDYRGIYIWAVAIDFPLQCFGFGRKCIEALKGLAKKQKINYLWCDSAEGGSYEFWTHMAFQAVEEFHKDSKTYRMICYL